MNVVMGIDPGVANTGFGVVRIAGSTMTPLDGGVIEEPAGDRVERRLARIHAELEKLIEWHEPEAVALENVYFGRNVRSALAVGEARGVTMLAAAKRRIPCFDYTPQEVKMAVCGNGAAQKDQVQRMVASLLGLGKAPEPDHAADALAVAICHSAHVRPARRTSAPAVAPQAEAAAG